MEYTPKQQEAIEKRGTNLLISAAAGSGKTRVLVDRIIHLLKHDGASLKDMLIVTFTNAAAGEMKVRLQEGLQQEMKQAETEDLQVFLREQLKLLPTSHISTMHAFCIAELRRYYHVLSLDPNFKILPASMTSILQENAMEATMNAFYESDDTDFQRLVEAYGGKNSDRKIRELIQSLAIQIQAHVDPLAWLHEAIEEMHKDPNILYRELLQTEILDVVDILKALCEQERALLYSVPSLQGHALNIIDDESIVQGLAKAVRQENPIDHLLKYLSEIKIDRIKPNPAKEDEEAICAYQQYKEIRDLFKDTLKGLAPLQISGAHARVCADRAQVLPYLKALEKLVTVYLEHYQDAKRRKDGVDFNDLEHLFLKLLEDEATHESIRAEVQYIFFDEYQDANPIQEAIIEALSNEDKLFFVGDVKQAIYRFRLADPNIFNTRYAKYREKEGGELIFLAENFRSRQEIINFCNALFEPLMTPKLGEVDYKEEGQALICGAEKMPLEDAVQCVGVSVSEGVETPYHLEALWIAEEIQRLVESGLYQYSDMAILMRSPRASLQPFEEVFKLKKIPLYADNSDISFKKLEVRLFTAMLTVLNNDELDQPLLTTLLSPFGGLNDEEVALIRVFSESGSFAKAVQAYRERGDNKVLCEKLEHFYGKLSEWRKALRYERLEHVAMMILEESGYGAFLLGMEEGVEAYENVLAFMELIMDYEKNQSYGLPGFLYYLEMLEKRNMDNQERGIALAENDGFVRLMSFHKSKGLGFKVVFLPDLKRKFNFSDSHKTLLVDKALGLAMQVVDLENNTKHTPFEAKLMALKKNNETRSEEVRLLYVALTRAMDRLYLVTAITDKMLVDDWQKDHHTLAHIGYLKQGMNYYQWLQLCMNDPSTKLYRGVDKPLYQLKHVVLDEAVQALNQQGETFQLPAVQCNEEMVEDIKSQFSTDYDYLADTKKPFKKTVSELTKGNDHHPAYIKKWPKLYAEPAPHNRAVTPVPLFLQEHVSLTGAAFGTLMHQVVQLIPFAPHSREDIEKILATLYQAFFFTEEEFEAIDLDMLEGFYQSDFVKAVHERALSIESEVSFTLKLEDMMVDGQIDLFFETVDGYEIIDFKTDRDIHPGFYEQQLAMYAEALSAARGKPVVKKWLYWLRHQVASEL